MSARAPGIVDTSANDVDRTRTYVLIVVVEIVIVGGLYLFGRYFS